MCRDADGGSVARSTSGRAIAPGRGRLRPRAAQALEIPKPELSIGNAYLPAGNSYG
jgi:hypothetical protein